MIKEWTERVLQAAHTAMTQYGSQTPYRTGGNGNGYSPLKVEPEIATLNDLRPIALLETTRKIWMEG